MDTDAAFAILQRSFDEFTTDLDKARTEQATSEELIASVEYELEQMKKLVAENSLPA